MTLTIDHHMLRFQVPIDYEIIMEMFDGTSDLSDVKLDIIFHSDFVGANPT